MGPDGPMFREHISIGCIFYIIDGLSLCRLRVVASESLGSFSNEDGDGGDEAL